MLQLYSYRCFFNSSKTDTLITWNNTQQCKPSIKTTFIGFKNSSRATTTIPTDHIWVKTMSNMEIDSRPYGLKDQTDHMLKDLTI